MVHSDNISVFQSEISESSKGWPVFIILFISSFEFIKVVVPDLCFILFFFFDFLYQLLKQQLLFLMELKYFFAKETATPIYATANLPNNHPENPSDWIILEFWALESFISFDILLLNAFLNFVFCLAVSNNSGGGSFPFQIVLNSFLKLLLSYF